MIEKYNTIRWKSFLFLVQCVGSQREIQHYDDLYRGSIIFVDYPFQCAGPVSGLQFYAERAGTFYLSVWRPNGAGDSWSMLGYNTIISEAEGAQVNHECC